MAKLVPTAHSDLGQRIKAVGDAEKRIRDAEIAAGHALKECFPIGTRLTLRPRAHRQATYTFAVTGHCTSRQLRCKNEKTGTTRYATQYEILELLPTANGDPTHG